MKKFKLWPSVQIILGFMGAILVGSFLLSLPIANSSGEWLNYIDSLFTSTSAVCVTGLIVVDTATTFTLFGEIVIMILIQIGGLGIVAVTSLLFLMLKKKISLSGRMTIKESLNKEDSAGVVKFIKKIIVLTFVIELIGALLLLYSTISFSQSFWKGLYYAIFMSISSFCNAGFDVLGSEGYQFSSLYAFADKITMLLPLMMLIVIGGIGFVVLSDCFGKKKKKQHTKIVLIMTSILIFGGAILFMIFEWNNPQTIGNMSILDKIANSFFQSISPRTAGIATLDQSMLTGGSRALTMFLMFVGGSPNSTAGGIKVTTLFVILLFMFKNSNQAGDIRLKDRKVSKNIIMKAFRLVCYVVLMVALGVILISIFEPNTIGLESIIFECISAISTVGLSMGITPFLCAGSKLVLIILMFAGRVGILTIIMAIASRKQSMATQEIEYINTDIMVG